MTPGRNSVRNLHGIPTERNSEGRNWSGRNSVFGRNSVREPIERVVRLSIFPLVETVQKRQAATKNFGKRFYKLLNNAFFGNTCLCE